MKYETKKLKAKVKSMDVSASVLQELRDETAVAKSADEAKATADEAKKDSADTKDAPSDATYSILIEPSAVEPEEVAVSANVKALVEPGTRATAEDGEGSPKESEPTSLPSSDSETSQNHG
jgi:hypothetical protein